MDTMMFKWYLQDYSQINMSFCWYSIYDMLSNSAQCVNCDMRPMY